MELGFWYVAARIGLAALIGGVIGLQREFDGQDAGFRTHLLVGVGSALFGVISVAAFADFESARDQTNVSIDITRVAAYVAPGIGFIGGGAILKHGGRVSGITTAASLWSVAAIGVASGLGFWSGAVSAGLLVIVALAALQPVSNLVRKLGRRRQAVLLVDLEETADVGAIIDAVSELAGRNIQELRYGVGPEDDGRLSVQLWRPDDGPGTQALLRELAGHAGVRGVTLGSNV